MPVLAINLLTRTALVAAMVAMSAAALGQDQNPAPSKDTIFARKILMGAIDMNMDEIETMLAPEGKLELAEGQEHAETISTMLMAFPHMFPASTNQWKQGADRDPALDTFASPDVWTKFDDFYRRATAASKLAYDASRAKRESTFRPMIVELRAACNGCHAAYMKTE
ncbi:MAG: cytochrome c [Pseudomonadota bacterium]